MPHLVLYTFSVLKSPLVDPGPLTSEFYDVGEAVYQAITGHPGHLAHAEAAEAERGDLFGADWGAWGEFVVPDWYGKGRTAQTTALAATLSLWTEVRSAFEAVYTGVHRAALRRRHDWFERAAHPNYVIWWVADGVTPTWRDGVARLEHLREHGASSHAFTFHDPFAPEGGGSERRGSLPGPNGHQAP